MEPAEKNRHSQRVLVISMSVAVSAILMVVKFYAYWITESSAILSDALESIINVVASGFALCSVIVASKPPDRSHPYGHGKIEYFSAGFEGALIILASVGIMKAALPQMLHPSNLPNLGNGLPLLLATTLVNLLLGTILIKVGKRTGSLVLVADGRHIMTDVYTTGGVLLGLLLVSRTGWYWLDGGIACLVAVNILVTGGRLVHQAFSGLMDASDTKLLDEISRLVTLNRRDTWIDVHRLRAWRSGNRIYVDFHLILPRNLSLEEAHKEVTDLERILRTRLPGAADAMIHAEPCIDQECPACAHDPCELRRETPHVQSIWHSEVIAATMHEVEHEEGQGEGARGQNPDNPEKEPAA